MNFKDSIKHIEVDSKYLEFKVENWDFKGEATIALAIGDEIFKKDEKGGKYTLDMVLEAKSLRTNPHILIDGKDICETSFGAKLGACFWWH